MPLPRHESRSIPSGRPSRAPWWSALRRRWPLRAPGAVLLAAGVLALGLGRSRMDLVLTLAGLFTLLLAALLLASLALRWLRLRSELRSPSGIPPHRLEGVAGREVRSGFEISRRRWPLVADPVWAAVNPAAEARAAVGRDRLRERLVPAGRGLGERIVREFTVEDLLGFWRLPLRERRRDGYRFLPDTGRISAAALETCLASGDLLAHPWGPARGDRVDQRPYTRSDPARLILWKVYARTRQLLVRSPEPARSPVRRPLVFLAAGADDEAAAGTALVLLESGLLGDDFLFAADGTPEPAREGEAAIDAIARSSAEAARGGADLARALASGELDADGPVIVICSAAPGPHLERIARRVSREPGRFLVLCAADVRGGDSGPHGWRRLVLEPLPWRGLERREWLDAAERFSHLGARAAAVDRTSGELVVVRAGARRSA